MEMERINENLIKVMIGMDDLEERGINFLDLIGDQSSIEQFFYSILEEVDIDNHFHDSEAVTFQVMPNSDGLELYISRTNFDEIDEFWEEEISSRLREHRKNNRNRKSTRKSQKKDSFLEVFDQNAEENVKTQNQMNNDKHFKNLNQVVVFQTLEDFLSLAREIPTDKILTNLYHMNGQYFIVIKEILDSLEENIAYQYVLKMLEFGEPHRTTENVLIEHGELLRESDTLEFFGNNI